MSYYNQDGAMMNRWHKTPNAIIDDLAGEIISPNASIILLTIIRYTWGAGEREWAAIPHSVFMKKTRTKRAETIGSYIRELTDCGLVFANRKNGKTTEYAINMKSPHIYQTEEVKIKTTTDEPYRSNRTGTDKTDEPLRMSRTRTTTDEPYSYKDNTNKDFINKDIKKTSKKNKTKKLIKSKPLEKTEKYKPQKPETVSQQVWDDLIAHRKRKKASDSQTAWTTIFNALAKAQQATGHTLDQIISEWIVRNWIGFKADWYINSQSKTQANTHANHQSNYQNNAPAAQYDTSTTAGYAAKLDADAAAYYAQLEAEQGANRGYPSDVQTVEGLV